MLRRSARSAFMPDVYVFPGGALDEADFSDRALARVAGIGRAGADAIFRDEPDAGAHADATALDARRRAGLIVTAARELYEEAGVLLTVRPDGARLELDADQTASIDALRAQVARGEIPFAALLENLDAAIDARAFIYFSHWITPPVEPRRFDAYFFLAAARPDEYAQADAEETHDGIWIAPHDALRRASEGTLALMFPTIEHLKRLLGHDSLEALLAFGRSKRIVPVMPTVLDGQRFLLDDGVAAGW